MNAVPSDGQQAALAEAATEILRVDSIVLASHVNPDGDALGSMLGLAHALRAVGKRCVTLSQDGVPEIYQFLPGSSLVRTETAAAETFPLAIVLDSGDITRIGPDVLLSIKTANRLIDIDHHISGDGFGDVRVIDATVASTAEIVLSLLHHLNLPITEAVAVCLFTGVITDTGSFRFQNVTQKTLLAGAELVAAGARPSDIAETVFDNRTRAATSVLGRALSSLQQAADGRVNWVKLSLQDFAETGARDEETEGIVNYARSVRGAQVGLFFREVVKGKIRISLRSQDAIDVAQIAGSFGGGGHRMAAGCTYVGTLEEAERAVIGEVLHRYFPT